MFFKLVFLFGYFSTVASSNTCKRELSYNNRYGYGYIMFCDVTDYEELASLAAYNEIALTISNSNLKINQSMFHNVGKLRELTITQSRIFYNKVTVFGSLLQLEKLNLTLNNLVDVPASIFFGLIKLKSLCLSHNRFKFFKNETFRDLIELTSIDLSFNEVTDVTDLNLCDLINLQKLILSHNKISNLNNFHLNCFTNLKHLFIEHNYLTRINLNNLPSLNYLILNNNQVFDFNLNLSNLHEINLGNNKISNLSKHSLNGLKNLIELNLSNNSLSFVKLVAETSCKIKFLFLQKNEINSIDLKINSLSDLDLSYNKLESVPKLNLTLPNLISANFSGNRINSFENFESNLRYLNLNDNLLSKHINFTKKPALENLVLSKNNITELHEEYFKNLSSLISLDLSENNIKVLTQTIFKTLENLESLNISHNKLTHLDYAVLEPLDNLRVLDLGGNFLKNLEYALIVSNLPNLEVINIKNNLLTCNLITVMLRYFKGNEINYTLSENLQYDRENVAGIYCKETEEKLISLNEAIDAVVNNTVMLNNIYNISRGGNPLNFGIILIITVLILIIVILIVILAVHRCRVYSKRKQYTDELELIGNVRQPYRSLNVDSGF